MSAPIQDLTEVSDETFLTLARSGQMPADRIASEMQRRMAREMVQRRTMVHTGTFCEARLDPNGSLMSFAKHSVELATLRAQLETVTRERDEAVVSSVHANAKAALAEAALTAAQKRIEELMRALQARDKRAARIEVTDEMVVAALDASSPDWDDEYSRAKARSNARNHMRKILRAVVPIIATAILSYEEASHD